MNKPSKKTELGCGCKKNTCTCDPDRHWPPVSCKDCPQSKKTEWRDATAEFDFKNKASRLMFEVYRERMLGADAIRELWDWVEKHVHQRDNKIREKIQKIKNLAGKRADELAPEEEPYFIFGYETALDDLLTYLSNREP